MNKLLLSISLLAVLPCLANAQGGPLAPALFASAEPKASPAAQPENLPFSTSTSLMAVNPAAIPSAPAQADQSQRQYQGERFAFNPAPGAVQAYFGYTFTRFEGFPLKGGVTGDGYDFGLGLYPWDGNFGLEGQFMVTYGNVHGAQSRFLSGMGGPTARISYDEGQIEFFFHGLAGQTHMSPQTADGSEDEPGFLVGGGMDLKGNYSHWALRLQADMMGTRFFNTAQYSPRFGAALVFEP